MAWVARKCWTWAQRTHLLVPSVPISRATLAALALPLPRRLLLQQLLARQQAGQRRGHVCRLAILSHHHGIQLICNDAGGREGCISGPPTEAAAGSQLGARTCVNGKLAVTLVVACFGLCKRLDVWELAGQPLSPLRRFARNAGTWPAAIGHHLARGPQHGRRQGHGANRIQGSFALAWPLL